MSSHQPGSLKQSNKKHKGSLSSKRAAKRALGAGKVSSANLATARFADVVGGSAGSGSGLAKKKGTKSCDVAQDGRLSRLNRGKQMREQKRASSILLKRLGTNDDAPKIVGLLSLCHSSGVDMLDVHEKFLSETSWHGHDGIVTHAVYSKHRTRVTFIKSATGAAEGIMTAVDMAKVADILVFVVRVDAEELIDAQGYNVISALKAVGCPEVLCCLQGVEKLSGKKIIDMRQSVQHLLESALGSDVKIVDVCRPELMCRQLCNATPRVLAWKHSRSFMLGDSIQVAFPATTVNQGGDSVNRGYSLQIGGFLRGKPLLVNSLVHIPGAGTCRVERVSFATEPFPGSSRNRRRDKSVVGPVDNATSSQPESVVFADPSQQDPLTMEAVNDGLSGEQTWPTEDEIDAAMRMVDNGAGRQRRNIPSKLPEGMSSYQADWFVDEKGVFDDDGAAIGGSDGAVVDISDGEELRQGETLSDDMDEGDEDFTMAGSILDGPISPTATGQAEKQRLRALACNDVQFPDEIDTPTDRTARERFARYRALQSFRASPWHPKENLPREYSRIFQFENFAGVQRRVITGTKAAEAFLERAKDELPPGQRAPFSLAIGKETGASSAIVTSMEEDPETDEFVYAGQYVHLVVDGLSAENAQKLCNMGHALIFGLHRHENRLSVLHFNIRRVPGYNEPIKSKEKLIFHAGFRTFSCNPIFSESNLNCDKHKLERFLLVSRRPAFINNIKPPLPCNLIHSINSFFHFISTIDLVWLLRTRLSPSCRVHCWCSSNLIVAR